MNIMTVM